MKKIAGFFTVCCMLFYSQLLEARPVKYPVNSNAVVITVTSTNPTCGKNNGTINVQASGGAVPYTYSMTGWGPQPWSFFYNVPPGTYVVLVTDALGASASQSVTLTNTYSAPFASFVISSLPTGCTSHNASITITGSGGVPPYLYSIDDAYFQTSNFFPNLTAGLYQCVVKDGNGCISPTTVFNNLLIPENCPMHQNGISLSYQCNPFLTDLALINVSGGTAPYMYSLDGISYQSSPTFPVPAGLYTIWTKDATGSTFLFTVAVTDKCTPFFAVTTVVQAALCGQNGTITVSAANGASPYQYSLDGITYQSSNVFTGLTPGNYTVRVKDANGFISSIVAIVGNSCLSVNATSTSSTCGNSNGGIQAQATTGTPPYLYSIDAVNFTASGNFTGLTAGNYTVTAKDATNNTGIAAVTVGNIAGPVVGSVNTTASACVNNTGSITISGQGGTPPLVYSIDGIVFNNNPVFTGLGAGTYTLTIKDANGCTVLAPATVTLLNDIIVDAGPDASICEGKSITLNGSSSGQNFSWTASPSLSDPTSYNPIATPIVSTMYYLNASSGTCSKKDSVFIEVKPAPTANAGQSQTICFGQNTILHGSGGISCLWTPSTYLSDPKSFDPNVIKPATTITYLLTVTDVNGCSSVKTGSVIINITPPPKVFAGNDTSIVIGQQLQLHATDVNASGFNQYTWTPSAGLNNPYIQDPVAIVNANTSYAVAARTIAGCEGTDTISIKAFTHSDIFVPAAFTPNGDGKNDILKAIPIDMKEFKFFNIYNRYGQLIFTTKNPGVGWDGKLNAGFQNTGAFAWIAEAIDVNGNIVQRRGTVIILR